MQQLLNWLTSLNWTALCSILVTFLTAYGGTLIGLVIGLIKTRTSKNKLEETRNELLQLIYQLHGEIKDEILHNQSEESQKRFNELKAYAEQRKKLIQDAINESKVADNILTGTTPESIPTQSIDDLIDNANE